MLLKSAADAITKRRLRGQISEEQAEKILKRMQNTGMLRPKERFIEGLNRGSENIAKRHGYEIIENKGFKNRLLGFAYGGYSTNPLTKTINKPSGLVESKILRGNSKVDARLMDALMTRHEAIESSYTKKPGFYANIINTNADKVTQADKAINSANSKLQKIIAQIKSQMAITGLHKSQGVLGREYMEALKIPYPEAAQAIKQLRTGTGERNILHSILGKDIYTQGVSKKDISKLDNVSKLDKTVTLFDSVLPNQRFLGKVPKKSALKTIGATIGSLIRK